jgi:hypothetical protein
VVCEGILYIYIYETSKLRSPYGRQSGFSFNNTSLLYTEYVLFTKPEGADVKNDIGLQMFTLLSY